MLPSFLPFLAGWTAFAQIVQSLLCGAETIATSDGVFDITLRFLTFTGCSFDPLLSLLLFLTTTFLWMLLLAAFAVQMLNNSVTAIVAAAVLVVAALGAFVATVF